MRDLLRLAGGGLKARRLRSILSAAGIAIGIDRVGGRVWLADRWFTVIGILDTLPLAPEIDRSALVGFPVAEELLGTDPAPGTVYLRTDPSQVDAVRSV